MIKGFLEKEIKVEVLASTLIIYLQYFSRSASSVRPFRKRFLCFWVSGFLLSLLGNNVIMIDIINIIRSVARTFIIPK